MSSRMKAQVRDVVNFLLDITIILTSLVFELCHLAVEYLYVTCTYPRVAAVCRDHLSGEALRTHLKNLSIRLTGKKFPSCKKPTKKKRSGHARKTSRECREASELTAFERRAPVDSSIHSTSLHDKCRAHSLSSVDRDPAQGSREVRGQPDNQSGASHRPRHRSTPSMIFSVKRRSTGQMEEGETRCLDLNLLWENFIFNPIKFIFLELLYLVFLMSCVIKLLLPKSLRSTIETKQSHLVGHGWHDNRIHFHFLVEVPLMFCLTFIRSLAFLLYSSSCRVRI